jgi:putative glutathione S-transferase
MGVMIDGVWHTDDDRLADGSGRFVRKESLFRNWVTRDGAAGPKTESGLGGEGGFPGQAGRYHLYVSWSCPWAHRTRLVRIVKRLEGVVGLTVVRPRRSEAGWDFDTDGGPHQDDLFGAAALHEIYRRADPRYSGRVTVPVLWDKERGTIVNNESAEIIVMFNEAFEGIAPPAPDLYPAGLRGEIDAINRLTYEGLNNGVYRAGFATSQEAYDEAVVQVFATLDDLEARLARHRYLAGDRLTLADWRVFPTLCRFDAAYVGAFKCNLRRLVDYPNLWDYTRELYQMPGVAETVDLALFKAGYYSKSALRNPTGIVPKGPILDFTEPHGRDRLAAAAE